MRKSIILSTIFLLPLVLGWFIIPCLATEWYTSPTMLNIYIVIILIAISAILYLLYKRDKINSNIGSWLIFIAVVFMETGIINYNKYKFYKFPHDEIGIISYVDNDNRYIYNRWGNRLLSNYHKGNAKMWDYDIVYSFQERKNKYILIKEYVSDKKEQYLTDREYDLYIYDLDGNRLGYFGRYFRDGEPVISKDEPTLRYNNIMIALEQYDIYKDKSLKEIRNYIKNSSNPSRCFFNDLCKSEHVVPYESFSQDIYMQNHYGTYNNYRKEKQDIYGRYFNIKDLLNMKNEAQQQIKNLKPTSVDVVDLGLSVDWASNNIGATEKDRTGLYFMWGSTNNSRQSSEDYPLYGMKNKTLIEFKIYNPNTNLLNQEHDAAQTIYGSDWRLPTSEEVEELVLLCKWEDITIDGQKFTKITGPSGKSILFPLGGYRSCGNNGKDKYYQNNTTGYYWLSDVQFNDEISRNKNNEDLGYTAKCMIISAEDFNNSKRSYFNKLMTSYSYLNCGWTMKDRYLGALIRPVTNKHDNRISNLQNKKLKLIAESKAAQGDAYDYRESSYIPPFEPIELTPVPKSTGHSCQLCGGSGRKIHESYAGAMSGVEKWCSECGLNVSAGHSHVPCDLCGGDGWFDPATD